MANFADFDPCACAQGVNLQVIAHKGLNAGAYKAPGHITVWLGLRKRLNLRMDEAVKLRDDLSRAITEAATAAAKAVEVTA